MEQSTKQPKEQPTKEQSKYPIKNTSENPTDQLMEQPIEDDDVANSQCFRDDSNWPLLGHVLEDFSILKPTNAHPSDHQGYRGLDLTLQYNLENNSRVVFCDTYTQEHLKYLLWSNLSDSVFCSARSN